MKQARTAALLRFVRTALPQVPAAVAYLAQQAQLLNLPEWVVPTLMLVGAIATALDKFLRDLKK